MENQHFAFEGPGIPGTNAEASKYTCYNPLIGTPPPYDGPYEPMYGGGLRNPYCTCGYGSWVLACESEEAARAYCEKFGYKLLMDIKTL
jgi:hypothetical protein